MEKERKYLLFNGRDLSVDCDAIEKLFGCGEVICTCFNPETYKYAFYNTGHLCQVSYKKGSHYMKVEVLTGSDYRKEDILHWLKANLTNGMAEGNISVETYMMDGCFLAAFYENE